MTDRDLGVGVVGAGYWGKNLVRNFARVQRGRLVAVADLDEANRRRARSLGGGARVTAQFEELLGDPEIDAVAVCTGASSHHPLARQALLADKDVFVEKPLALATEHAEELVALAQERGRVLMVGHLMLFHPAVEWIRGQLLTGEFGEPYYLYCHRLNLGIIRSDESAWWSLAPHDISLALHLLDGRPTSVSAQGNAYLRREVEDVVFANLQFTGGQAAQIHTSWLDPHKIRKLTLVGSRRMVTFDDTEPREKVRVYDKGAELAVDYETVGDLIALRQGDIRIPNIASTEPLLSECQHFVDCVRERRQPRTPGQQGLDVVRILNAGQRSMEQAGAPVTLSGPTH